MTYLIIWWGFVSDKLQSVVWNGQISLCFDVFLSGFLTNFTTCTKFHVKCAGLYDLALQFIQNNTLLRRFNSLLNWKQQWCTDPFTHQVQVSYLEHCGALKLEGFVPLGRVKIDSSGLPNRLKIRIAEIDNISLVWAREESDYSLPSCMTMEHHPNLSNSLPTSLLILWQDL